MKKSTGLESLKSELQGLWAGSVGEEVCQRAWPCVQSPGWKKTSKGCSLTSNEAPCSCTPIFTYCKPRQTQNCNRICYKYESPPLKKCLSGFLMSIGKLSSFLALNPMMSSSLPSFLVNDWATNGSGFKMRHLWTTGTMGALWPPKRTTSLHTRPDWNYGNGCLSRQSVYQRLSHSPVWLQVFSDHCGSWFGEFAYRLKRWA